MPKGTNLEHLQQLLILTCYSYNFAKNSKTPLQQLPIFTSYFSQLAKFLPRARIVPRAAFTSYRRFRRLPRPPGPSRARAYSSRADPERSISPSRAFKDLPARLLLFVLPASSSAQFCRRVCSTKVCRRSLPPSFAGHRSGTPCPELSSSTRSGRPWIGV